MSRGTLDLTTGGIFEKMLKVAVPIMGIQFIQMAYNLTDMFWLGRLSSDAVAATGTAGMYLWMSMAFMMFGRMGAEIGVSQNLGRGDTGQAVAFSRTALTLNLLTGLGYMAIMLVFAPALIGFFGIQEAHVAADAVTYLRWVSLCIPFQYMTGALAGTFSACGVTKIPLVITAVALLINVVADPLFIFTLNMGVAGAAIATVVANGVGTLAALWVMGRSRHRPFEHYGYFTRLRREYLAPIATWATPVVIESFAFTFLSMLVSRVVSSFGAGAIAVQKLGSQIESLSWLIAGGFASALTAFVGQNYGAGKWGRIHRSVVISYQAMAVWGAFVTVLLFFGGGLFFSFFVSEADVIAGGATMMRYTVIGMAPTCLENVAMGAFRGVGRTRPPAVVSITANVLRVPLSWWLSTTSLGINGVWLGLALGALFRGVWVVIWQLADSRRDPQEDLAAVEG